MKTLIKYFPQRAITMIPAHDSPLSAISFDWHGTKLATASEKVNIKFFIKKTRFF